MQLKVVKGEPRNAGLRFLARSRKQEPRGDACQVVLVARPHSPRLPGQINPADHSGR